MANVSIHDFHGGLILDDHKALSTQHPLAPGYLPKTLVVPLQQHIGQIAEPCVKVGDHVLKGQLIAKASEYVSANIHAPSSGTVTAIDEHLCKTVSLSSRSDQILQYCLCTHSHYLNL